MAGTITPRKTAHKWDSNRILIGSTRTELVKPSDFKATEMSTIMIQAANSNNGTIYVSANDTLDNLGTGAGFEIQGGEAVVLPIGDIAGSEVYVIGTDAADTVNVSYFGKELLC